MPYQVKENEAIYFIQSSYPSQNYNFMNCDNLIIFNISQIYKSSIYYILSSFIYKYILKLLYTFLFSYFQQITLGLSSLNFHINFFGLNHIVKPFDSCDLWTSNGWSTILDKKKKKEKLWRSHSFLWDVVWKNSFDSILLYIYSLLGINPYSVSIHSPFFLFFYDLDGIRWTTRKNITPKYSRKSSKILWCLSKSCYKTAVLLYWWLGRYSTVAMKRFYSLLIDIMLFW